MKTNALPANGASTAAVGATGVSASNPLQMLGAWEETEALPVKQNPFLKMADVRGHNPLQLLKQTALNTARQPVQLISGFSKMVLRDIFIPLLIKAGIESNEPPREFIEGVNTVRSYLEAKDDDVPVWQTAHDAIVFFFETVFHRYRLTLGRHIIYQLDLELKALDDVNAQPLIRTISGIDEQFSRRMAEDDYVELDVATIDRKVPLPEPLLRGLIWNLHGFSNTISGDDRADFKVTAGGGYYKRLPFLQEIFGNVKRRSQDNQLTDIKKQETAVGEQMAKAGDEELKGLLSPTLNQKQKEKIYGYVHPLNSDIPKEFAIEINGRYRVKQEHRKEVIDALKSCLSEQEEDSAEHRKIDALLGVLQASDTLNNLKSDPAYISNLLLSFQHITITGAESEPALLQLIRKVKELRAIIKALSTFIQSDPEHELHVALNALAEALNKLVNRHNTNAYEVDNNNLAIYLDKELNKYAIVTHLTSLLNSQKLNLDFMLLNEMNRGIRSFSKEVRETTGNKYEVKSGAMMAAMKQDGNASQREYYPLVYNTDKFTYLKYFYVGIKEGALKPFDPRGTSQVINWMKPENKGKNVKDGATKRRKIDRSEYLDYRPIIVHCLKRKKPGNKEEAKEIWLAAVHTTPYGTEFDRKKIFDQLKEPLAHLKQQAESKNVTLIIGGDFYIAAEALSKSQDNNAMYGLDTETGMPDDEESYGNQNETRNLRDSEGGVYSFTHLLAGDKDPAGQWKNTRVGMGLQDMRSITGTNKNAAGLQSADYFIVRSSDKKRVRVGLIDPRTREIVELESEDEQSSRHNFHFSDHLISAIELYHNQGEREKRQLNGRFRHPMVEDMHKESMEWLNKDAKKNKFEVGDFEPRPDISNLITTFLFSIWSMIANHAFPDTNIDINNESFLSQEQLWWKKLLDRVEAVRQNLKDRLYEPADMEKVIGLTADLKRLNNSVIVEYANVINSLVENYVEKDVKRTGVQEEEEEQPELLLSGKKEWGKSGVNYPAYTQLPSVLKWAFNENLLLGEALRCRTDTKALEGMLMLHIQDALMPLHNAIAKDGSDIDDKQIKKEMKQAGVVFYVYELTFFEERNRVYIRVSKTKHGSGVGYQFSVLNISSGFGLAPYPHSGYHQLL